MKKSVLFFATLLIMTFSNCTKNEIIVSTSPVSNKTVKEIVQNINNNPIKGNWEIGAFKILCGTDTTIYPNAKGDFIFFNNNDTAYYTYNSTNAKGWSPYQLTNDSTFILNGDTMHIISYDGINLTTYCKPINSSSRQWMTYIKK